ncbi:hypothetical protein [Celeribacter persicus]|uniref:DNA binding protein with HTH domain n=1 Tax=Celeribacter persicus TaxID=1651082 RepID=A0A2T5GXQ5_9RHOB|nr:hypothetical protein [Celeribacter persicus]PTQ64114.1 DNA binding protein with HTH domain [Celeribacter persicus]
MKRQSNCDKDDLWFLPGPIEEEPDFLPPGPRADPPDLALIDDWVRAQAIHATHLAKVAGRLGALDERLRLGPEGWRRRLALIEAAELSWLAGDRVHPDQLALWISMRGSSVRDDTKILARIHWAVRHLTEGPAPLSDLAAFLDRRDPEHIADTSERFEDRAESWRTVICAADDLHPISRACMGFHLWNLAGLGRHGDQIEAAVTAARIAASDGSGAIFAPLAMGGAGGLRSSGEPPERLARWLDGMNSAILTAMRHLDDVEAWAARAEITMAPLSGRTPPALRRVFTEWPVVSAPMAEALTGASRAAVQRNLAWMEAWGLIREVTGQGRFRLWRI